MSEFHLHPDRAAADALADAIDLCRRIQRRNDVMERVHHHAWPGSDMTAPDALCGHLTSPRPYAEALALPCCPLCHAVIDELGWRCQNDKKDG